MTDELETAENLLPIARRIADGLSVDWEDERARATTPGNSLLDTLTEIASVGAAHRAARQQFDTEETCQVLDRWRHLTILEALGSGQFGTVSRAYDPTLQIEVALKLSALHPAETFDASRALHEARQLAKVHHPNVVRVYGADYSDGRAGIWMDLVRGRTLADISNGQRFGAGEAGNIGIQMCRALAAVHGEGVLHGDIKPNNVIRRETGDFVLVDFGASRTLEETPGGERELAGTLVYMAPEVLKGAPRSRTSDIYSLGVLLFRIVTETYPVFADSVDAMLAAYASRQRKRLRDLRPDLPGYFVDAVERAVDPDPAARWSSAAALEAALRQPAVDASARRTWWREAAVGVVLLLALAAGVWRWTRPSSAPGTQTASPSMQTGTPVAAPPVPQFTIDASFHRVGPSGAEPLRAGQSVRVNDQLYLSVNVSRAAHVYVVDEDEAGKAFLLFPLANDPRSNPIPAGGITRIPAAYNWTIDSAGGSEHLLVFANLGPLDAFEDVFKQLPAPRVGGQAQGPQLLPGGVVNRLRGAGTLAPTSKAPPTGFPSFRQLFQAPLAGPETASGLWVRQLTLQSLAQ